MTGQDLIEEMLELAQATEEAISDYRTEGIAAAQADRTYRVEKAKKMKELRASGWPATTTEAMANGYILVADARLARQKSDALRDASKEAIQLLKRRYDLLKSMWERENR